jgi:predicted ATPase
LNTQARHIDNLRAALDWSYSERGDVEIGERLTVAAVPLWMHLSLVDECRRRAQRVFADRASPALLSERTADREMRLQAAQGAALVYTSMGPEARAAWERALQLAEQLDNVDFRLRSLWGLWVDRLNGGRFQESLSIGQQYLALAETSRDANERAMGHRLVGVSLHFLGDLLPAEQHLRQMLDNYVPPADHLDVLRFQFDPLLTARCFQARVRWLLGHPNEALQMVDRVIDDAIAQGHPLSLINSLGQGACLVTLYSGDYASAHRYVQMLLEQSARHGIVLWHAWARCFAGALAAREGRAADGVQQLRAALTEHPETRRLPRYLALLGEYARALSLDGRGDDALITIDEALARSQAHGECWYLPELQHIEAEALLAARGAEGVAAARMLLAESLTLALSQSALSWQLRSATTLFRLESAHGVASAALATLRTVVDGFDVQAESLDLRTARDLLASQATASPTRRRPRESTR